MRNTYHLCLSSHDEVMCRDEEDLIMSFNCLAIAVLETDSRLIADGQMSTHFHAGVCSDYPKELMKRRRYSFTRYFNRKYMRKGRMGERIPFISQIEGARHVTAMTSYVKRQGVHHGLAETAFGYRHCSANVLFAKELGKIPEITLISERKRNRFLPDDVRLPACYRMSSGGLLLREDIIDVGYAEEIFHTPQGFLFHMNRKSDNRWIEEQKDDGVSCAAITLESIEPSSLRLDFKQLRKNEFGNRDYSLMNDIELCEMLDSFYTPRQLRSDSGRASIYLLDDRQRADMANRIWTDMRNRGRYLPEPWNSILSKKQFSIEQLGRCCIVKPSRP